MFESDPAFHVLHALRVKGFAKAEVLMDMTGLDSLLVESELTSLQTAERAVYREARALWSLSPTGKEFHGENLAAEREQAGADIAHLRDPYGPFLDLNGRFKTLCGDWQLRSGAPNDHTDIDYDGHVLNRLTVLHETAVPIVHSFGERLTRFRPYANRLVGAHERVLSGQTGQFTGVMCNSYHDIWMELHEDLIVTLGIDRHAEGSY